MKTIALTGNPNCGKTTIFNAMTGSSQYIGNWPGVTVEKKEGRWKGDSDIKLIDLPGIYSLSPYSLDEVIARNFLLNENVDLIVNVVDATNLERNLYLTTQLLETGIPVVVALNMMDLVKNHGDRIHIEELAAQLHCPVIPVSGLKNEGLDTLADTFVKDIDRGERPHFSIYSENIQKYLRRAEDVCSSCDAVKKEWYAIKLLEKDEKMMEHIAMTNADMQQIDSMREEMKAEFDDDIQSIIADARYVYISDLVAKTYTKTRNGMCLSDRIDSIVTNRVLALPIFAAVMYIVYYVSVTTIGGFVTDWTNDVLFTEIIPPFVEEFLISLDCAAWLSSLILDGIIAGIGAVLGFVPQMFVLFFFLALLEDCGYMARIAFIMDRIFRKFGLSGKSFIPMLIGTGCGVPGIMASRTIENEKDRRMTIMTTTFIPCSAKLPIIALIAGALFDGASWVAPSAYFIGIAAIVCSGIILKKTRLFAGDPSPFIMELPAYHMPQLKNVLLSMWERGSSFIKKAGTIILLSTIVIWFASRFGIDDGAIVMLEEEELSKSFLAVLGSGMAPLFAPLGWGSWQAAVAAITGLVAKENVVATFGILFGFGEVAEDGVEIWNAMALSFTAASAFSFLVFNLLCAPCFAAMGAIRREMNHTKWTVFAIGYQCLFAYLASFVIYQFAMISVYGFTMMSALAVAVFVLFVYLLFRKPKSKEKQQQKEYAKA